MVPTVLLTFTPYHTNATSQQVSLVIQFWTNATFPANPLLIGPRCGTLPIGGLPCSSILPSGDLPSMFICYHCKAKRCSECIGIPCQCPCPVKFYDEPSPVCARPAEIANAVAYWLLKTGFESLSFIDRESLSSYLSSTFNQKLPR